MNLAPREQDKLYIWITNTGDRAIQVGSHFHLFEANRALQFDRVAALGMHLDLPAGTAVRFEPGDTHEVQACSYAGSGSSPGSAASSRVAAGTRQPDEGDSPDARASARPNREVEVLFGLCGV